MGSTVVIVAIAVMLLGSVLMYTAEAKSKRDYKFKVHIEPDSKFYGEAFVKLYSIKKGDFDKILSSWAWGVGGKKSFDINLAFSGKGLKNGTPLGIEIGSKTCGVVVYTDPEDDPYTQLFKKDKKKYYEDYNEVSFDYCRR